MGEKKITTSWSNREYWEGRFEASDTPWELGAPSRVLMEACSELSTFGVSFAGARVLSPGCGRGADALELVSRGASVIGIEWSRLVAEDLMTRYKAACIPGGGRLEVRIGDFFTVPSAPFDIVCEHTFMCALDPSRRAEYAERIASWVKPGGYLCGNFFIVNDDEIGRFPGLSLTKEGFGPPFGITRADLESLLARYLSVVWLRPGLHPAEGRRAGLEWVGVFQRR